MPSEPPAVLRPRRRPARPAEVPDSAGVLTQAVLRASGLLGLSQGELARTLGISEASVSRLASGSRSIDPHSKEGELALLLVRLYRSLDALVGNDAMRRGAWFGSLNHALNGRPAELVLRAEGLAAVVAYLDGMRAPL